MKIIIPLLLVSLLVVGCSTTKPPRYNYSYGSGRVEVPLNGGSSIDLPLGSSKGIRIRTRNGSIRF